jgi:hypothetical protein
MGLHSDRLRSEKMSDESGDAPFRLPSGSVSLIVVRALCELAGYIYLYAYYVSLHLTPNTHPKHPHPPLPTSPSFAMPSARHNGRWEYFQGGLRQTPLDALNNWEGRAQACVDWQSDSFRAADNTAVHIMVPLRE